MSRAEERRKARKGGGSDMKRFYAVLAAVAVLGIGFVGYTLGSSGRGEAASAPVDIAGLDDPETLSALARGAERGDPESTVTIVEFGDFQCPGCGAFGRQVEPRIVEELVETGRAKFVFYDYPLVDIHPNAFLASRAARCAEDQGEFWAYHDALFGRQQEWSTLPNPADTFEEYAESIGIDGRAFGSCLASDRHAELVSANLQLAQRLGVARTPTLLVNVRGHETRNIGDLRFETIVQAIEEMTAGGGSR